MLCSIIIYLSTTENANFIRREKGLCQGALVITVHLIGIVDIVVPIPMNVKMKRGFMTNGIGMNISRKRIFPGSLQNDGRKGEL